MVQMSIVAALHDWGVWQGEAHPLEAELLAGMGRFYDPKLKTLRRYLPNVGDDKNADAVDSWYLYHPLLNLGKLAPAGNARAKRLFLKSIDRKSVVEGTSVPVRVDLGGRWSIKNKHESKRSTIKN